MLRSGENTLTVAVFHNLPFPHYRDAQAVFMMGYERNLLFV